MYIFVYIQEPFSLIFTTHSTAHAWGGTTHPSLGLLYVHIICIYLLWSLRSFSALGASKKEELGFGEGADEFGSRFDSKLDLKSNVEMNSPRSLRELGNSLVFRTAPNQLAFNSLFLFRGIKPLTSFANIKAMGGFLRGFMWGRVEVIRTLPLPYGSPIFYK